ncbi:hypothetical protein MMC13_007195 [Lambiella insularis]|nr:hypothetical protein [Lambiella insularis]
MSNSNWSGAPIIVVTGSSTTNRTIHIFAVNTQKVLRYFYIPLQANGLPGSNKIHAPDRRVDCVGEVAIANTSGGAITAFTYNRNLHVLYPDAQGNLVGQWRGNDSGTWASATLPKNISVGGDPRKGDVNAVIVQSDF